MNPQLPKALLGDRARAKHRNCPDQIPNRYLTGYQTKCTLPYIIRSHMPTKALIC